MRARRLRVLLIGLAVCTVASISTVMATGAVAVDLPAGSIAQEGQGALAIEAVDESGRPLAVRARIVPTRLWRDERVLVNRDGHITSALPEGSYRISITHGPEWSVWEQTVDIQVGRRTPLRARLEREVDASSFTACDFHVHTAESPDSNLDLRARIDTLLAEDVQFVVLTDHNRVTEAAAELAAVGIGSLPGVEVTTWDPELGHFNVFPRQEAPRYRHANAHRLLRELRKQSDSFVQMNHPRLEGHIGYFELAERARASGHEFPMSFDGIEVWNGYDLAAPNRRQQVFVDWLALIARGQHITATGNSDSHKAGLAPHVGYPRTYVQVPRARAEQPGAVLSALKQGRAFVTNGPIIDLRVRGKQPGESVWLGRSERAVSVQVDVAAPAWMELREVELWLGKKRVAVLPLALARSGAESHASARIELPVSDEKSLVATVRGTASMKPLLGRSQVTPYAFTNPVWLTRH